MPKIVKVRAREILDSRGNPTLEVDVTLAGGSAGVFKVPAGASKGQAEALEMRDKDSRRYLGLGLKTAINIVEQIIMPELVGIEFTSQAQLDDALLTLDGTPNKTNLGANSILGTSIAFAKACAAMQNIATWQQINNRSNVELPLPLVNIINGGCHADNSIAIQEFMLAPVGASNFSDTLMMCKEVFLALKSLLRQRDLAVGVGDEGGFAPDLSSNREVIELILKAISDAGFQPGVDICLALDVAASELLSDDKYQIEPDLKLDSQQLITYLACLVQDYPIVSIEDGLGEHDWEGWLNLSQQLGNRCQLVGDDIFVTNINLLKQGIESGVGNAILIKPNQIGTLTETLSTIEMAKANNYSFIISHRSGETEDTFIADLAVATAATQIKTGGMCRSERIAKYNRLLRIADDDTLPVSFNGRGAFEFLSC